ncbi:MAG: type IV pilus twitching motility protein PilT [Candidatus Omnitrophica bacterium]|nr:type IV pilus twitching motility protein PilT [Candidatus Omnitrophota bacterium]
MEMSEILKDCIERDASDIHIAVGRPVTLRVHGELVSINDDVLNPEGTEILMKSITSDFHRQKVETVGSVDFGFAYGTSARFRVSAFRQKGVYGVVLRLIPNKLKTFEEIGLSPRITELLYKPRGLVLVTGPTGSGKSTTLATMINYINENRSCHIITVEDPIEYYHEHKRSLITQREVGVDVPSFHEALIRSLRQDPDVLLVGEMRDLATMEAAITAAETGHLVFSTLHTTGAARTVDRIIDAFPSHQQEQIRTQLSSSIVAVISQLLIPRVDGQGRVAAFEIMITTPAISNLIRENKTYRITSDIQTGAKYGMKTLDSFLMELYSLGLISYEEMIAKSYDPDQIAIQAAQIKTDKKAFFATGKDGKDKKRGWV